MAEGDMHFRKTAMVGPGLVLTAVRPERPGRRRATLRSAADRTVWGHILPWRTPTRIWREGGEGYLEWFTPGAVDLSQRPRLRLKHSVHGGLPCGRTLALVDAGAWLDACFWVDEGEFGDGVLDLIDRNERVPLSIGFRSLPGADVWHKDTFKVGVERTKVRLSEVAICAQSAYAGAYIYGRGSDSAALAGFGLPDLSVRHLPGQHNQESHGNDHTDLDAAIDWLGHVYDQAEYERIYGDPVDERAVDLGFDDGSTLTVRFFENGGFHVAVDLPDGHYQVMAELDDSDQARELAALIDELINVDPDEQDEPAPDGIIADNIVGSFYVAKYDTGDIKFGLSDDPVSIEGKYFDVGEDEAEAIMVALERMANSYDTWDFE